VRCTPCKTSTAPQFVQRERLTGVVAGEALAQASGVLAAQPESGTHYFDIQMALWIQGRGLSAQPR
jgi:hypothetical protein